MTYNDQLNDIDKRIELLTKDIQYLTESIKEIKEGMIEIKTQIKDSEPAFNFVKFIINHPMLVFWGIMMILYLVGKHLLNINIPFIADK